MAKFPLTQKSFAIFGVFVVFLLLELFMHKFLHGAVKASVHVVIYALLSVALVNSYYTKKTTKTQQASVVANTTTPSVAKK